MPAYTHVACPSCGTTLRAGDMNLQSMAATCHVCHALVDLRSAMSGAPAAPAEPYGAEAAEPIPVPLPAGLVVDTRGGDLVIVRRWFSWVYIFLAFFCVVWDGMLVFFYGVILSADGPLFALLFPLLHVAAGVFITYLTIAGFVNRTTFRVERGHLAVRHGPLPWAGSRDVSTESLQQLFCTENVSRGKNGVTIRYGVEAVLRDGRALKLAQNLDMREQALFIEQAIEKHLGIRDQRVRSEMAR